MTEPLRQDIERALRGEVDPNKFEACAASLLRSIYPGLVLVPGRTDFGQDGVIRADDGTVFPLVCTTGQDASGNLKRNLKTYRDTGCQARRAVFATTRPLSARRRANLDKAAAELGFELDQIYDHNWFLDQLYYNDGWRLALLGLTGRPSALSEVPRSRRVTLSIPLVGRDLLLDELRQLQGDLVIYGEPGVGKTYLLQQLAREGWGLFLVDRDPEALANGIRRQQPRRIIVDDAHLEPAALTDLKRMRARLKKLSRAAKLNVCVEVDPELEILYPPKQWPTGDVVVALRRSEQRQAAAARRLALSWATRDPEEVAARLAYLEGEARAARLRQWPWFTPLVCQTLAEMTEDPAHYARALHRRGAPVQLMAPFLDRLLTQSPAEGQPLLEELLDDERARLAAILSSLQYPVSSELLAKAIGMCDRDIAPMIRDHVRRFTPEAQRALLEHDDIVIVQAAVVGLAMDDGTQADGEIRAAWRRAAVRCPADDYWIPRALQGHPELIAAWVDGWIQRSQADTPWYEHLPDTLLAAIGSLPLDTRIQILHRFPPMKPLTGGELVAALVGRDLETAEIIFTRQELKDYQPSVLSGPPDDRWVGRARIALAHGWAPKEIVTQSARRPDGTMSYVGRESALWAACAEHFERLRTGSTELHQLLADAGVAYFAERRDRALKHEADEAVYGR